MSILNGLLGNLDELATKLGLPSDKVQGLVQAVQDKMANGGDMMSSVTQAAQEHGVSLESLKGLMANGGSGAQDLLGKVTSALDKDGDGNPLNDLGDLASGFFGKK